MTVNTSKNPAKARPLSANVIRLMRLSRASPANENVIKSGRTWLRMAMEKLNSIDGELFKEEVTTE